MLKNYITGYVLSLATTLVAFGLVAWHLPRAVVLPALVVLALSQLVIQLVFFLHFGRESKGWNWFAFLFAVMIVVFIVGGTFWIMSNLQHAEAQDPFMDGHITPQASLDD